MTLLQQLQSIYFNCVCRDIRCP